MRWQPLLVSMFLASLLMLGIFVRLRTGRLIPEETVEVDESGKTVVHGRFTSGIYKKSPSLWLAYTWVVDLVVGGSLLAGVIYAFRLSLQP